MPDVIDEVAEKIINDGVATPSQIVGCSEAEVEAIERRFGVRLPAVYRSFLLKMGKGAGGFMPGMDAFLPDLLDNREAFESVLRSEPDPIELKPTHFVIMCLQGYSFEYIDTVADSVDPPVFAFGRGQGCKLFRSSLSEYYRRYAGIKD